MKPFRASLVAALSSTLCAVAVAVPMSYMEYKSTKAAIVAKQKSDKAACDGMSGVAMDLCKEQSRGSKRIAMAELEVRYQNSAKHRYGVSAAKAKAAYATDKIKCETQIRSARDTCQKEAEVAYTTAMSEAKLVKNTSINNSDAEEKITDAKSTNESKNAAAKKDATAAINDAQFKNQAEKCDTLVGSALSQCIADARKKYLP